MPNPRQRRKARSSSHRPVSLSKNAKRNLKKTPPIRGPKALQNAWDRGKTTKQNYAALGLAHSLNPLTSGGSECEGFPHGVLSTDQAMEVVKPSSGRIVRDGAGEVVRIQLNERNDVSVDMDMEQLEPSIDVELLSKWATGKGARSQGVSQGTEGTITRVLECMSTPQTASNTLSFAISGIGSRHPSTGEVAYLQRLVNKHGDDVEKMSRDRKFNPEQRTVGQLRSALRRAGLVV